MTATFKIRLQDNGQMGCNVYVLANGKWNAVINWVGAAPCAWDNRAKAIEAAKKWWKRYGR